MSNMRYPTNMALLFVEGNFLEELSYFTAETSILAIIRISATDSVNLRHLGLESQTTE